MKMLTTKEVAKKLNMHYMTIYQWCHDGVLPAIQIDKVYRIDEDELAKFLETKKRKAKGGEMPKEKQEELPF